ncbi:SMP-30/gluconolactonase/LRE family protein [Roseisalinus antarcticus]|uniref:Gluconolactonase n=1 Tax=Roseisalinus antarcticus TaxID=254357 RepID=A0A1Y5SW15_9RHOB|nr:SMP-30/gluconolactonase/LRE family protein [Roseisalinus antarcticus]SLN49316.1 Gluconolactonase precursor [Roseisalinus antarcticus]
MSADDLFDAHDPRFHALVNANARLRTLHTGSEWVEGPAYFAGGRYLIWSDIPNDRMLRLDEADDSVSLFRQPSGNSNGNTVDRQGRLISCEHGRRRVSRTEHDGSITVIADAYQGKRLNSPNDVVVKSDGTIWFTDPAYGIESDYEGNKAAGEIGGWYVFRVVPETGEISAVITGMVRPNGLAFSFDETRLYVSDSGKPHHAPFEKQADMMVADVAPDGSLGNLRPFTNIHHGGFDGFRLDTEGRIWAAAGANVECYAPDATLLGRIKLPETVSNLCFGGPKRNILYVTATTSLYRIRLMVNGAKTY